MLNLHRDHLTSEGFTPEAIDRLQTWGVRSITNQEAKNLGIAYQGYSPSGLWFPFQGKFVWLDRTVKPWLVLLQTVTALLSISPLTSVGCRSCLIVGGSATLTREDSLRGLVRCRGLSIESCNLFGDRLSGGVVYQHCQQRRFGAMSLTGSGVRLDALACQNFALTLERPRRSSVPITSIT
jgi:hypothetical protein